MYSKIRMEYNGATYEFSRDTKGRGYWYLIEGTMEGAFGSSVGLIAYSNLNIRLTSAAISRELGSAEDFAYLLKKERPATQTEDGKRRNRKPRKDSIGANPFASGSNSSKLDLLRSRVAGSGDTEL